MGPLPSEWQEILECTVDLLIVAGKTTDFTVRCLGPVLVTVRSQPPDAFPSVQFSIPDIHEAIRLQTAQNAC